MVTYTRTATVSYFALFFLQIGQYGVPKNAKFYTDIKSEKTIEIKLLNIKSYLKKLADSSTIVLIYVRMYYSRK